jgi:hypothetical protein
MSTAKTSSASSVLRRLGAPTDVMVVVLLMTDMAAYRPLL